MATNLVNTNTTSRAFLAKYISYARKHVNPIIPEERVDHIVAEYLKMRDMGVSRNTITATNRQLESMIRIAEANAKMRLSPTVEQMDVDEAIRLITTAMQQSATDPKTGEIDMDIITTGVSKTSTERIKLIREKILDIQKRHKEKIDKSGIKKRNLYDFMVTKIGDQSMQGLENFTETEFNEAIKTLEDDDILA